MAGIKIKITETQYSDTFEDLLDRAGWVWVHSRPAKTEKGWRTALSGYPGFPDYFAIKPPRCMVVELKSDDGELNPEQYYWLAMCHLAGIEAYVFQPKDDFQTVAEILFHSGDKYPLYTDTPKFPQEIVPFPFIRAIVALPPP